MAVLSNEHKKQRTILRSTVDPLMRLSRHGLTVSGNDCGDVTSEGSEMRMVKRFKISSRLLRRFCGVASLGGMVAGEAIPDSLLVMTSLSGGPTV